MSLKAYRSKRDLKKSHEPLATPQKGAGRLQFCIQRHAARHLHYDLRLEYQGILLSWAVPKGPSLDPREKRLAIKVEDHPLSYLTFEGTIPPGNYGAGQVEIWDRGTYCIPNATTRQETENGIAEGLRKGHFMICINGEKLRGEFIFQKLKKEKDDQTWLLIKKEDPLVASKTTMTPQQSLGKRAKMEDFIAPMLASLVNRPFDGEDWLFEIKWDGYRALAFIDRGQVKLKSRTNHLWNEKFPAIVDELKKIEKRAILDGELVVVDSEGRSHFQLMQNYQKEGKGTLFYYIFDLLYLDGRDLRQLPLLKRKDILKAYLQELSLPLIRFSNHIVKEGISFFEEASKLQLEGIMGKKIESPYHSGRSQDWVKIKTHMRQEVVIGGFTAPRGSRKKFGALLVGVYDEQKALIYAGHVGGGFNATLLQQVYDQLKPLIQQGSPFETPPKANAPVTWVKPQLICEVSFTEWTNENLMRQPIFHGLRTDKAPKEVTKETPLPALDRQNKKSRSMKTLSLSHLDKIFWQKENYTKGDLIAYYEKIAPYILPYLKNRPIVLHRYPEGIEGVDFYQKGLDLSHPEWIKTFPIQHTSQLHHYLLINDLRSLLYAVNLGSIDLHPFLSRIKKLENPDYCVIDLDPHQVSFEKLIETALAAHDILEAIQINHYCKTSGSKGLHVFIPLHGKYDYEQSRKFAEIISICIHKKLPHLTSLERNPKKREKKIYLDCLQNRMGQTIVAPYAVRPRPEATVSTPLTWDEVNGSLDQSQFTIKTIPARLEKRGDIFKPILGSGINIKAALASLNKLL